MLFIVTGPGLKTRALNTGITTYTRITCELQSAYFTSHDWNEILGAT
jgi:hypothetical protein